MVAVPQLENVSSTENATVIFLSCFYQNTKYKWLCCLLLSIAVWSCCGILSLLPKCQCITPKGMTCTNMTRSSSRSSPKSGTEWRPCRFLSPPPAAVFSRLYGIMSITIGRVMFLACHLSASLPPCRRASAARLASSGFVCAQQQRRETEDGLQVIYRQLRHHSKPDIYVAHELSFLCPHWKTKWLESNNDSGIRY